jgi:hypothetical protein
MFVPATCRALTVTAALLFVAGCAGGGSSPAPGLPSTLQSRGADSAPAGYRWVQGPALLGPLLVRTDHPIAGGYLHPGKKASEILYVADVGNNVVQMYDPNTVNPTPIGSITSGIDAPIGLAVDKAGTLYVANISNATVTEYAAGSTTPTFTITNGMSSPYGIGVDTAGDVFVANLGTDTVTAYKPGQTSPYATISNVGPNPVGVGVDGKNNVYICDDSDNTVYEIAHGSTTATNSGLTDLAGPLGISFTKKNTAYVSNFSTNKVQIYPKGSTTPTSTITDGITAPTLNGFAKPGTFFQSNQGGLVEGYQAGSLTPFSAISGLSDPDGIASTPRLKP